MQRRQARAPLVPYELPRLLPHGGGAPGRSREPRRGSLAVRRSGQPAAGRGHGEEEGGVEARSGRGKGGKRGPKFPMCPARRSSTFMDRSGAGPPRALLPGRGALLAPDGSHTRGRCGDSGSESCTCFPGPTDTERLQRLTLHSIRRDCGSVSWQQPSVLFLNPPQKQLLLCQGHKANDIRLNGLKTQVHLPAVRK